MKAKDPVSAMISKMVAKRKLHFKTHRQGNELRWDALGERLTIYCFTHKRWEPASWL